MIENLQDFIGSQPALLQWIAVMIAGAIPYVESYGAATIGVIAGVPTPMAIAAGIVGNIATMVPLVIGAHAVRSRVAGQPKKRSVRHQRLRQSFDKFGVAGLSLVGQTILPSQITSAALVSFGAPKNKVLFWQTVSISLWGTGFGILATFGINLLESR